MNGEAPAIKYDALIDLANRNNSHTLLHELATVSGKPGLRILEVGCSSGYLGASLMAKGHHVTGVEPDPASARVASGVLAQVWNGGLDDYFAAHPEARFDVLIFGDVLEHMLDPAPGGHVAISLPNVAHGSVRAMLLSGRFDYHDRGILDRTHLRFFTRGSIAQMLADAGLALDCMFQVSVPVDAVGTEYAMALDRELVTAVELLSDNDPSGHAFQYVLLARPSTLAHAALVQANDAVPVKITAPLRAPRGSRSVWDRAKVALFRRLLKSISARRFRAR
jgi:SAM-dependent methyltransferase